MNERQRQAAQDVRPREEAALPAGTAAGPIDSAEERRTAGRILAYSLLLVIGVSLGLEYGGWQIVLRESGPSAAGIDWPEFLRGALDTMGAALGVGAVGSVATLLIPSSWRRPWRQAAVGFLSGASVLLVFLSWLTLSYFL